MGCPSAVDLGDALTFSIRTHDPSTGVLANAGSLPTYRIYEESSQTPIVIGTMIQRDPGNLVGSYFATVICSAANGFETDRGYSICIDATISGNTGGIGFDFRVPADVLGHEVPSHYATGTAGWALGRIGSGMITTVSPIASDGLFLTIVRGDDYLAADGRAIDWIDTQSGWPDLTDASVQFTARKNTRNSVLTSSGSVINATGANKKVRFEFTRDQTALLKAGDDWRYDIQATLSSGGIATLVLSQIMEVAEDMTVQ